MCVYLMMIVVQNDSPLTFVFVIFCAQLTTVPLLIGCIVVVIPYDESAPKSK